MAKEQSRNIPIEKIHDLPGLEDIKQPDKAYGSLVSSILINGVKEPVILRSMENGEYQVVAGYRRKRAVELAKLQEIPALIYDMTEKEALEYRAKAEKDPKTPIPGKLVEEAAEEKAKADSAAKTEDKSGEKAAEPAPPAAGKEKKPAAKESKPKSAKPREEAPAGPAAVGPTGTVITKILDSRLNPPTAKDKKSLPVPGEGEAFSVILHPAFLKKAEINTFSVDREADDFKELYKSIERFGVKDPVLARVGKDGELEILSGQRRHLIAGELNYPVPTIIQQLDDDDAKILVADGNLHREHISTYDQARALRMKADSMKRKAGRRSKGDNGPKMDTDEILAKEMGMSTSKLNRLMKLSEATRGVCELVDEGALAPSIAYNIAFLSPQLQDTVVDLIGVNVKVSNENTGRLKEVARTEKLDVGKVRDVLEGRYPPPKTVETPRPVEEVKAPAATAPIPPASSTAPTAPASIPKAPDIPAPPKQDNVVPFAPPVPEKKTEPASHAATVKAAESQDKENSYVTKVILTGDRPRKYFPDVSMTPREIEDSVYDALEERRQRQERLKQKTEILKTKTESVK